MRCAQFFKRPPKKSTTAIAPPVRLADGSNGLAHHGLTRAPRRALWVCPITADGTATGGSMHWPPYKWLNPELYLPLHRFNATAHWRRVRHLLVDMVTMGKTERAKLSLAYRLSCETRR